MQLHYLLVVVVVSDIRVMSSTVAVIFAIASVVNNYNIQTEPSFFLNGTEPNSTEPKKNILHIPAERVDSVYPRQQDFENLCYNVHIFKQSGYQWVVKLAWIGMSVVGNHLVLHIVNCV